MDAMEPTTTITNSVPLAWVPLPSGNTAAIVYTATLGDVVLGLLLLAMVCLQVVAIWRWRRS
jgi:hypothetical protein